MFLKNKVLIMCLLNHFLPHPCLSSYFYLNLGYTYSMLHYESTTKVLPPPPDLELLHHFPKRLVFNGLIHMESLIHTFIYPTSALYYLPYLIIYFQYPTVTHIFTYFFNVRNQFFLYICIYFTP